MKANGAIREDLIRLQNSVNECIDDLTIARERKDDGEELIALRRMEALLGDVKQTCISVLFSLKEEPVSEELKEFEREYIEREKDNIVCVYDRHAGLVDGAKWQKEQFERERLKHCEALTEEQAKIESDFVTQHLKENNRTPTFIDAIEYGMRLQRKKKRRIKNVQETVNSSCQ